METYDQLKAKVNNIQSTFTSTDLITRLASKEIYDYCMLCVIELEKIAMTSKTLNEKLEKLRTFIASENFTKIDAVQMTLLNIQVKAMETYSQCLLERIVRL